MRKLLGVGAALALCAFAGTALGQATDDCASSPVVGDGWYTWTLVGATHSFPGSCGATGSAEDVFLQYVPTFTGIARASTCGNTGEDTVISVHTDCAGTEIACLDDFCGLQTELDFAVTAGVPHYVRIASFAGGATGSGLIVIYDSAGPVPPPPPPPPPPPNDDCAGSIGVSEGSFPFDTSAATTDSAWACGFGGAKDLHWTYTPTADGASIISLCGSGFDTMLMLGTFCGGSDLGCIDDFCGLQSQLNVATSAGVPIHITIGGYNGQSGTGTMSITAAPPPPANDNCGSAEAAVDGVTYTFDTTSATLDGTGSCGASGSSPDVWFDYVPSNTGCATIDLCGSFYDTVVEMFDACGGASMGCNDDFCGLQSTLSVNGVTAGTHYAVRVSGFANQVGAGQITFSSAASTPYTPPGSGTVEPEPCDPFTPDVINAGCNSDPPSYGSISCGETILGTGFWNGSLRDTDWFNFSLAADDTVTFSGQMMFGGVAYGLQVVDCPSGQINFWAIGGNTACSPDFSISAALPAGDYTLFIAPSFAAPLVNCGVNDQYWVTMTTGAGCGGNPCDVADTNCDGALNGFDVQATEEAVNGDFTNFCQPSADLNGDGAENGFDVEWSEALVNMC